MAATALEGNVRLYHVVDGQRTQFVGADLPIASDTWYTLCLVCFNDHFEVYLNDQRVISARDATLLSPGSIGLWTKADSVTAFDDLQVWRIQPAPGA